MENKIYKRQFRERDEITKAKISNSLRNRSKTPSHCQAISDALKSYWQNVPSKNKDVKPLNNDGTM